jgi:hypothetical protein
MLRRERLDVCSAVLVRFSDGVLCGLVESKMRASTNVIHPRPPGDNAGKERASV